MNLVAKDGGVIGDAQTAVRAMIQIMLHGGWSKPCHRMSVAGLDLRYQQDQVDRDTSVRMLWTPEWSIALRVRAVGNARFANTEGENVIWGEAAFLVLEDRLNGNIARMAKDMVMIKMLGEDWSEYSF